MITKQIGFRLSLLLACLPATVHGEMPPAPLERRALIVSVDPAPVDEIVSALQRDYGFTMVVPLLHAQATRTAVVKELYRLTQGAEGDISLLVYVSLPSEGRGLDLSLVPFDGQPGERWSLIPTMEMHKLLLGEPRVRESLLILPRCEAAERTSQYQSQYRESECLSSDPSRSVTTLSYCASGALGRSRAGLADAFLAALRDEAPGTELAADELPQMLQKRWIGPGGESTGLAVRKCPEYGKDYKLVRRPRKLYELVRDVESAAPEARAAAIDRAVKEVLSLPTSERSQGLAQLTPALLRYVTDRGEPLALRTRALLALGELKEVGAVASIGTLIGDGEPEVTIRRAAVDALSAIGGAEAAAQIRKALNDADSGVRISAIRSLGLQKDPLAREPILALVVNDPMAEVRVAALEAAPVFEVPATDPPDRLLQLFLGRLAATETDERVRAAAVSAIERARLGVAHDDVVALLHRDTSGVVRAGVAYGLGRAAGRMDAGRRREVEAALVRALERDADADVKVAAAWALGHVGGATAEAKLIEALGGRRPAALRQKAAGSLGQLKSTKAVRPLVSILENLKEPAEVRLAAAAALGAIADPAAIDPLFLVIKDEKIEPYVREAASKALQGIESSSVTAQTKLALKNPSPAIRADAVHRLGQSQERAAFNALLPMLIDPEPSVRQATIEALARYSDPVSLERFEEVIDKDDGNLLTRIGVVAAVARQGTAEAATLLLAETDEEPATMRAAIIRALTLYRYAALPEDVHTGIAAATLKASKSEAAEVRKASAEGLAGLDHPDAMPRLRELSKDQVPDVARAALDGLGVRSLK